MPDGTPSALRQRVLDYLDTQRARVIDDLIALIRIPSVSGSPDEVMIQSRLATELAGIGLAVDHWEIPVSEASHTAGFPGMEAPRSRAHGLVGRLPGRGGGPALLFNAHVDVVPPGDAAQWPGHDPFSGRIHEGSVLGRGSCDMKGGLVAALWAVRALVATGIHLAGDLLIAFVPGEEDGGLGTWATLQRGWRADACVIPEPTGLDLVPANAGSLTFRLRVPGRSGHASRRTAGVSAIEKFLPVFTALRDLEAQRNRDVDPLMARWDVPYAIEIGRLSSGAWASSVPDLLTAEGRFGVVLDEPLQQARAALEVAVTQVCAADPWLRDHPVQVEWWGGVFASARTDPQAPIVQQLARAHTAVTGAVPQIWGAPYGSDLRLLTDAGIPTVQYGPGNVDLAHSTGESVRIEDVLTAARTLALVAMDCCGVAG